MSWILVLTIGMADYRAGFAIASVPGFKSVAACELAASAWLRNVAARNDQTEYWRPRAICLGQP